MTERKLIVEAVGGLLRVVTGYEHLLKLSAIAPRTKSDVRTQFFQSSAFHITHTMRFGGVIDIFQVYILLDTEFLKRLLIYLFQFPRIFLEDRNDSEKTA